MRTLSSSLDGSVFVLKLLGRRVFADVLSRRRFGWTWLDIARVARRAFKVLSTGVVDLVAVADLVTCLARAEAVSAAKAARRDESVRCCCCFCCSGVDTGVIVVTGCRTRGVSFVVVVFVAVRRASCEDIRREAFAVVEFIMLQTKYLQEKEGAKEEEEKRETQKTGDLLFINAFVGSPLFALLITSFFFWEFC